MGVKLCFDLGESGFLDLVPRVSRKFGKGCAGEGPAGPGAPFALKAPRLAETIGVVLEMDARVSEEGSRRGVLEEFDESGVGERPGFQGGFAALQVRAPSTVETEDGSGGKSLQPKVLRVFEASQVELGLALLFAKSIQRAPIHTGFWAGKASERADGRRRGHRWVFSRVSVGQTRGCGEVSD